MQRIDLLPYVQNAQHQAVEWITWVLNTQVTLASVLGLFIFIALLYVLEYRWHKRDGPMAVEHNKQIVQLALADALTELYLAEKLSIKDYHYWNHRLGNDYNMPAMQVRKIIKKRLAKYVKAQLQEQKKQRRINGQAKPMKIPGPLPGEDVKTVKLDDPLVNQLKRFFAQKT